MKWYSSVVGPGPNSLKSSPSLAASCGTSPCSRSAHPARRRSTCPVHPGSRSRNRAHRARCPSPSACSRPRRPAIPASCSKLPDCRRPVRADGGPARRKAWHAGSESLEEVVLGLRSSGCRAGNGRVGFFRSVGAGGAAVSQLSPYWSLAPHFGHSPLMKRSGRNICFTGS